MFRRNWWSIPLALAFLPVLILGIHGYISLANSGGPMEGTSPLEPPAASPELTEWYASLASLPSPPIEALLLDPGLLVNGNFDQIPFYWRVPNHWIAGGWARWWTAESPTIPEYDDVRPYSPPPYEGNHAQVYFKWGTPYEAGLYQVVNGLTPCIPYRLTLWTRNDAPRRFLPHARIGLDPQGTQLTTRAPVGPEDEDSVVRSGMPPLTVWASEQTRGFTWEELSVETEPLEDRMTVILYARPEPLEGGEYYFTTFWDAGRLITSTYPGGRLPDPVSWTPSEFITNVVATPVLDWLIIEWDTKAPASTQVWYDILSPTSPTITGTLPYTIYLPLILRSPHPQYVTPLDPRPVTHHRVEISGLEDGQTVRFYVLSRRPLTETCVTEIYGPMEITVNVPPITRTYLPLVLRNGR